jgi:hypothetical protein
MADSKNTVAAVRRKLDSGATSIDNFSTTEQNIARKEFSIDWNKNGSIKRATHDAYKANLSPSGKEYRPTKAAKDANTRANRQAKALAEQTTASEPKAPPRTTPRDAPTARTTSRAEANVTTRTKPVKTSRYAPSSRDASTLPSKEATWLKPADSVTGRKPTAAQALAEQQAKLDAAPRGLVRPDLDTAVGTRTPVDPTALSVEKSVGPYPEGSIDRTLLGRNRAIMGGTLEYPQGAGGPELYHGPPVQSNVNLTPGSRRMSNISPSTEIMPAPKPGGLARIGGGVTGAAPNPTPIAPPSYGPNLAPIEAGVRAPMGQLQADIMAAKPSAESVAQSRLMRSLPAARTQFGVPDPAIAAENAAAQSRIMATLPAAQEETTLARIMAAKPATPTAPVTPPAEALAGQATGGGFRAPASAFAGATEAAGPGGLRGVLGKLKGVNDFAAMPGYKAAAAAAGEGGAGFAGKVAAGLKGSPTAMGFGIPIAGGLLAKPTGTLVRNLTGGDENTVDEAGIGASDFGQFAEGAMRWGSAAAPIAMALPVSTPFVVGAAAIAGGLYEAFTQGEETGDPDTMFDGVKKIMQEGGQDWDKEDQGLAMQRYQLMIEGGKTPEEAKTAVVQEILGAMQAQAEQADFDARQMTYNRDTTELMLALQKQQLAAQSGANNQYAGYIDQQRLQSQEALDQSNLTPAQRQYAEALHAQSAAQFGALQNAYMQQTTMRPTVEMFQNAINSRQGMNEQLQSQLLQRQIAGMIPPTTSAASQSLEDIPVPAA